MPEAPNRMLSSYKFEKAATWSERLGNRDFQYIHENLLDHSMSQLFGENWRAREAREGLRLDPPVRRYVNEHFKTFFNSFETRWSINAPKHAPSEVHALVRNELEAHKQYQIPYPGPLALFPEEITGVTKLLAEKRQFMTGKQAKILQLFLKDFYKPREGTSPTPKYPPGYKTLLPRIEKAVTEREREQLQGLTAVERNQWEKLLGKRAYDDLTSRMRDKMLTKLHAGKRSLSEADEKYINSRMREFFSTLIKTIPKRELEQERIVSDEFLKKQLDAYLSGTEPPVTAGTSARPSGARKAAQQPAQNNRESDPQARLRELENRIEEERKKREEEKVKELEDKLREERNKREEAEKKAEASAKEKKAEPKIEIRPAPKVTIFAPAVPAGGAGGGAGGGQEGEWWMRNVASWGAIVAAVAILVILSMTVFK